MDNEENEIEFLSAILDGDARTVDALYDQFFDLVITLDGSRFGAWEIAIESRHVDVLMVFLNHNYPFRKFPHIIPYTIVLELLTSNPRIDIIKKLLDMIDNPKMLNVLTEDDDGQYTLSPLILAVTKGRLDIVQMIVEYGANVNIQTDSLYSPLHYAVMKEDTEIVKYLLENGAHPNTTTIYGNTPLHLLYDADDDEVDDDEDDEINETIGFLLLLHGARANRDSELYRNLCSIIRSVYESNGVDINIVHMIFQRLYGDIPLDFIRKCLRRRQV